jgi:hypothetical protein
MKYFQKLILFMIVSNVVNVYSLPTANRQPPTANDRRPTANCQRPTDTSSTINRQAFYKAVQSDNKELVNAQLTELTSVTPKNTQDAFLGTMTMKKAGLGGSPITKLHLFKVGHKLLETAILQDPNNAEFRFLRLMIQENAPGILGYKSNEEKDSEFIRKSYKSLLPDLQHVIADYNKKSKVLKLEVS